MTLSPFGKVTYPKKTLMSKSQKPERHFGIDGGLADVFELQDRIASSVARAPPRSSAPNVSHVRTSMLMIFICKRYRIITR